MLAIIRGKLFCFPFSYPKIINTRINRTIILSVALYGCETWSVIMREELRLRVFQNRVLRGIFGRRRDEVKGEWRRQHNEELYDLYRSPIIVRLSNQKNEMGGACNV